jgi:hypothetical protein
MKKPYSLILSHQMRNATLLLIVLFSFAAFHVNSQEIVSVGLLKMNVLYRGVDNPATVTVSGVAQSDIKVKFSNGTFKIVGNNYLLNPTKLGDAVLSVFVKDREVGKAEFRVKDLPDPVAKLKGHRSGTVEKSWLALADKLTVELDGTDYDYRFTVIEFTVTTMSGGHSLSKMSKSDQFTTDQLNLIKNVNKGEKVLIEDIKIMGPEGSPHSLMDPLVFSVK